ncbi:MAG: Hsp20/alpha crystallin family protein [Methylococcaceae bacterium]|nr:Hsp20/alpha crystallin family protein [Methylococcaceae bacterium]MCI0733534.1 Hsp20/alpha crystallin family protein [Methylococcaceae bacterium]
MSEAIEVTTQQPKALQESTEAARVIRPPVDIFEDDAGITVQADLPGVSKERLSVHLDKDSLAIEGTAEIPVPEGMQSVYADIRSTHYQRSFSLSSELDGDQAEATLKDGILTLRIPKRAQYQPRKIEIRVG